MPNAIARVPAAQSKPTPEQIEALRQAYDQAFARMAAARRALSAAQSEYAKARKAERAALEAKVAAMEAFQNG